MGTGLSGLPHRHAEVSSCDRVVSSKTVVDGRDGFSDDHRSGAKVAIGMAERRWEI